MPATEYIIYQEANGRSPLIEWLKKQRAKVQDKCIAKVKLLQDCGYELRPPHCRSLRDKIRELRIKHGSVNYRILYAFTDQNVVLLTNGCTKEKEVPDEEIERARRYLENYLKNPEVHTYELEREQ